RVHSCRFVVYIFVHGEPERRFLPDASEFGAGSREGARSQCRSSLPGQTSRGRAREEGTQAAAAEDRVMCFVESLNRGSVKPANTARHLNSLTLRATRNAQHVTA